MRKLISAAVAMSGILFAGAAVAQSMDMYTTGSGDKMMVMGGNAPAGGAMIMGSKDKCATGAYYMSGKNMVTACGDKGMSYDLSEPASGAMMAGKPMPQGAMMMKQHAM